MLLGFDPGKQKCGVAVMGLDRKLHFQAVIPSEEAIAKVGNLLESYPISLMVMGDQTASKQWKAQLQDTFANLRIITVSRDRLIVFTGVSVSGKSSLAFDTICAEGQRSYVESLSAYARQFLGQVDKTDVDYITCLEKQISIKL